MVLRLSSVVAPVALLTEGVGRNRGIGVEIMETMIPSPSSRRAWVEIAPAG